MVINTAKEQYVITFQDKVFWVNSFYCNINQKSKIFDTLGTAFITENQGIPPFEIVFKGYFDSDTPLDLAGLYNDMLNYKYNSISIKNVIFDRSRLIGVKFSEDTSKSFTECELKFLVEGSVTS
ncbi:MAG: hypothetical protein LBM93_08695 [Oscillospiraceae bacterium]|jgi:hypothetical protein|nr:hypothetical protein [Oscillospiraceae bacterium]